MSRFVGFLRSLLNDAALLTFGVLIGGAGLALVLSASGLEIRAPIARPGQDSTRSAFDGRVTWRSGGTKAPESRDPAASLATIQIGPVPGAVATEIVGELTLAGIPTRVTLQGGKGLYRVLSEPMGAMAAARLIPTLAHGGLSVRIRMLTEGTARLDFGVHPTEQVAESVADRARKFGIVVDTLVESGAVIAVGPLPRMTIDEIVRTLRARSRFMTFSIHSDH